MKQDSKQVQVDLQDLGYETCGRSENEAEREETTSPGKSTDHGIHISSLAGVKFGCSCSVPLLNSGKGKGDRGPEKSRKLGEFSP